MGFSFFSGFFKEGLTQISMNEMVEADQASTNYSLNAFIIMKIIKRDKGNES